MSTADLRALALNEIRRIETDMANLGLLRDGLRSILELYDRAPEIETPALIGLPVPPGTTFESPPCQHLAPGAARPAAPLFDPDALRLAASGPPADWADFERRKAELAPSIAPAARTYPSPSSTLDGPPHRVECPDCQRQVGLSRDGVKVRPHRTLTGSGAPWCLGGNRPFQAPQPAEFPTPPTRGNQPARAPEARPDGEQPLDHPSPRRRCWDCGKMTDADPCGHCGKPWQPPHPLR